MNALSEFLKELDPSQIDEAVKLLQRMKKTKETCIGVDSYSSPNDNNPLLQDQSASPNSNFTNASQENSSSKYADFDTDDIPLMYTRFARSSDFRPIIQSDEKLARRAAKKARHRKEPLNRIDQFQDRACVEMPLHPEKPLGKNGKESNPKAVSVKPVAPIAAIRNLNSFGFLTSAAKATDTNKNRLFPFFVQDKREIPEALQFWKPRSSSGDTTETPADARTPTTPSFGDEASSLLHPPMCAGDGAPCADRAYSFQDLVEAGGRGPGDGDLNVGPCTGPFLPLGRPATDCHSGAGFFQSGVAEPYRGFNREVVFVGSFAVGYDPCQARPAYFGTCNPLPGGGGRAHDAWHQLARFPAGEQMPRFPTLDYDYDSGDDWDVMDGEDIGASSPSDSNSNATNESFNSSDLDFINDDDDDDDSDCELYRRIIEARRRRLNRLRGKDKLVPLFSGPFVAIPVEEHPLRRYDRLEVLLPVSDSYFSSILENEVQLQYKYFSDATNKNILDEDTEETRQQQLLKAALKNRREMTDDEINAVHNVVNANGRVSARVIVSALRDQHMCVGVSRAEIERTVKRFYERKRGILVRRDRPWLPTDERLFCKINRQKVEAQCREGIHASDPQSNGEGDAIDDHVGAIEEDVDANEGITLLCKSSRTLEVTP